MKLMKGKIYYKIVTNAPVAVGTTLGSQALAGWLCSDVQYSFKVLDEWIRIFLSAKKNELDFGYKGTGNTTSILVSLDWILVENEFIPNQKTLMSYEQMEFVLQKYQLFLFNYHNKLEIPPLFEFEYEKEGDDAYNHYLSSGGLLT